MNAELLTWGLPLVAALALFTLAYTVLPAASRSGDYWMAAIWFLAGAIILVLRFGYWGLTSPRGLPLRVTVCAVVIVALSAITVQAVLSINYKRKDLLAKPRPKTETELIAAKPIFKVEVPAALPGHVELDANMYRTTNSTVDSIFPVVARFQNSPELQRFSETDKAWARVVYKDTGIPDLELARADVGCWIDEPIADIAFPFGKARYLLLGGWHVRGKQQLLNEFRVFEYSRELHRATEKGVKITGPRQLLVEVTLSSAEHPESRQEYRFELNLLPPATVQGRLLTGRYSIRQLNSGEPPSRPPRVERGGIRTVRVPLDPETNRITASRNRGAKNNLVAYLAKFYYAPEPNTPDWVYVTAHVTFYHGSGAGVYKAFRPVWFETETNKQKFQRAEAHELVVLMGAEERVTTYESTDTQGEYRFHGVYEHDVRIEIELIIERDDKVKTTVFNYQLTGRRNSKRPTLAET